MRTGDERFEPRGVVMITRRITRVEVGSERGTWNTPVATAGAGWVFPLWRGLYLNPWGAVHLPFDTGAVQVGSATYQPHAMAAEVSLKIGWSFSEFGVR